MSTTNSASSTPNSTPSRQRTAPRPPPSPLRPDALNLHAHTPSPASNLSAVAGSSGSTPRRASTPLSPVSSSGGKTRARDLLRKHYGLGVGPPPPLSGPNKPLDPMDIDSPAFDAKSYYEQLITTSSLSGLLKRENELLSEIRQLESERQSLVYNHHHELIAASDTISAMKNRAESVDADLDKLRVAFSEISRLNEELGIESAGNDNR
ncbi:uncharacterized protein FOMMEDRAFT_102949 [Fomitiporia mediterranea MF3/22]|uniref:uncharacterized protein n=1 Tax=Fomitiporia mediterranea (strain MF3/22) TaxID=694068 RepID=UPI000440749D|nr:uncharacterized protein FOMMEDRAFT_102949 [Fomitiporia mediterranea MF3/22]EJD06921.1 hypothetical protein FOMMEDRAFT_102949 [Fomitiporia mediterranea MF3/22]